MSFRRPSAMRKGAALQQSGSPSPPRPGGAARGSPVGAKDKRHRPLPLQASFHSLTLEGGGRYAAGVGWLEGSCGSAAGVGLSDRAPTLLLSPVKESPVAAPHQPGRGCQEGGSRYKQGDSRCTGRNLNSEPRADATQQLIQPASPTVRAAALLFRSVTDVPPPAGRAASAQPFLPRAPTPGPSYFARRVADAFKGLLSSLAAQMVRGTEVPGLDEEESKRWVQTVESFIAFMALTFPMVVFHQFLGADQDGMHFKTSKHFTSHYVIYSCQLLGPLILWCAGRLSRFVSFERLYFGVVILCLAIMTIGILGLVFTERQDLQSLISSSFVPPAAALFLLPHHQLRWGVSLLALRTLVACLIYTFIPESASTGVGIASLMLMICIPVLVLFGLLRLQNVHRCMIRRTRALSESCKVVKAHNSQLLHSLFPAWKAATLGDQPTCDWWQSGCDTFEDVSIVQLDISGFTELSARLSSADLLDLVNSVFTAFDGAADCIGNLWKVETIGDCYKAVSGGIAGMCPCGDHPERAVSLALAMAEIVRVLSRRLQLPMLSVRVGVATGSLTAAVVGTVRPRYLIYGPTCREAGLMEANAEAGCVRVSPTTGDRLGPQWERAVASVACDGSTESLEVSPTAPLPWQSKLDSLIESLAAGEAAPPPIPGPASGDSSSENHIRPSQHTTSLTPIRGAPCYCVLECKRQQQILSDAMQPGDDAFAVKSETDVQKGICNIILVSQALASAFHNCALLARGFHSFHGLAVSAVAAGLLGTNICRPQLHDSKVWLGVITFFVLIAFPVGHFFQCRDDQIFFSSFLQAFLGVLLHANSKRLILSLCCFAYFVIGLACCFHLGYHHKLFGFGHHDDSEHHPLLHHLMSSFDTMWTTTTYFVLLAMMVRRIQARESRQRDALRSLQLLVDSQDSVLRALVPEGICLRLQAGETHIAEEHPEATVTFVYIDSFDEVMARYGTEDAIEWVQHVFCEMDAILSCAERSPSVTKIESFNNFYMTVCGLNGEVNHADESVLRAIDIARRVCKVVRPDGERTTVRIGVNSGPLSSGVIGVQSPRFSVFGDTVNIASRMASSALPSKLGELNIHVSESCVRALTPGTRDLLQGKSRPPTPESSQSSELDLARRGDVWLKGKGTFETWQLSEHPLAAIGLIV